MWVSASGSEGGTGDFSPETALLAALAGGQTSCSVLLYYYHVFGSFRDKQDFLFLVLLSRSPGYAVPPEKNG